VASSSLEEATVADDRSVETDGAAAECSPRYSASGARMARSAFACEVADARCASMPQSPRLASRPVRFLSADRRRNDGKLLMARTVMMMRPKFHQLEPARALAAAT
jgi:hypothetical protein